MGTAEPKQPDMDGAGQPREPEGTVENEPASRRSAGDQPPADSADSTARPRSADARENLAYVRGVMEASEPEPGSGSGVLIWWGVLTLVAFGAMTALFLWAMHVPDAAIHWWEIAAVWSVHNLLGWTGTLWAVRRHGVLRRIDRQDLEAWALVTAAIWALVFTFLSAGRNTSGVILFPATQCLLGLGLAFSGVLHRGRWLAGAGVSLIALVPVVALLLPPETWVTLVPALIGLACIVPGVVGVLVRRRHRAS